MVYGLVSGYSVVQFECKYYKCSVISFQGVQEVAYNFNLQSSAAVLGTACLYKSFLYIYLCISS